MTTQVITKPRIDDLPLLDADEARVQYAASLWQKHGLLPATGSYRIIASETCVIGVLLQDAGVAECWHEQVRRQSRLDGSTLFDESAAYNAFVAATLQMTPAFVRGTMIGFDTGNDKSRVRSFVGYEADMHDSQYHDGLRFGAAVRQRVLPVTL